MLVKYIAALVLLGTCISMMVPLAQEVEACLAADIVCAAAHQTADEICDEVIFIVCVAARVIAQRICDWAEDNLCPDLPWFTESSS